VGKVHIKQCGVLCGRCDLWHGIRRHQMTVVALIIAVPASDSLADRHGGLRRLARICVCGSVWFGSGRNKFVQLLIRSRNSSGRFVQSLKFCIQVYYIKR